MASTHETRPWPTEVRLDKDRRSLKVAFEDGANFTLPAEYLRVESPSAEVQGHSPEERKTVPGKRDVEILEVLPVGNYAVRLVFDDMHSTGISALDLLDLLVLDLATDLDVIDLLDVAARVHELGREQETRFQRYLDDLAAKGLSREPLKRS